MASQGDQRAVVYSWPAFRRELYTGMGSAPLLVAIVGSHRGDCWKEYHTKSAGAAIDPNTCGLGCFFEEAE